MQKRQIVSWFLCAAVFAVLAVGSFQILFRVLAWAGPAYGGGEPTLMGATGRAMARPLLLSLLTAIPASYIPRFRDIPGRYLIAWGALFFSFCSFSAIRIYLLASGS
jgi:hypothetical protein